jgi:hypothetical protein
MQRLGPSVHPYARVLNQSNIPAIEHILLEFEQWQTNKNVSANLDHTVIALVGAPIPVKRMGCAKSATRRGGQQKPILMARRHRDAPK